MKIRIVITMALALLMSAFIYGPGSAAQPKTKYASIIIDADSLEILHARNIDAARYPASLTKMMTLYLTFDALERGQISLSEPLPISARAASTPAVKLGLRRGRTISVENAIQALAVRSANDAAVVLAERISGSEDEFAQLMTQKAKALGMQSTIFRNAHGLPNPGQTTTARDMAKLGDALLRNHRQYYHYFSQKTFRYGGRSYTNHNALLGRTGGVDGFKTGYTNASGYNLALSAQRDGRRIIAVVLGGASGVSRDRHMADLIERGFEVLEGQANLRQTAALLNADIPAKPSRRIVQREPSRITALALRPQVGSSETVRIVYGADGLQLPAPLNANAWAVQIGAFSSMDRAQNANAFFKGLPDLGLYSAEPQIIPVPRTSDIVYRARLGGLTQNHANSVCKTLAQTGQPCHVIAPG